MAAVPFSAPVDPSPDVLLGQVEAFLTALAAELEPAPPGPPGRGRPRILPALALWGGLLVCVLRGWTSQKALWRLLAGTGLWHFTPVPVSDEAVYRRLAAADPSPVAALFADLTAVLLARTPPDPTLAPFAAEVVAVDETTLDPIARRLPDLRGVPPRDARLLPGKLAGVFDVRRQLWRRVEHVAAPRQNEKVAARGLVADLPPGSLILADLGYFAFPWFDELTDAGQWWVSRLRAGTSTAVLHVLYADGDTQDAVVWLGAHRADRAKHAVRRIQFRQGGVLRRYVTNVLDPAALPLGEVARLYARRWDIEMAVDTAKSKLDLHLLWSAKDAVLLHQVWAVLVIAQVLQALRGRVADLAAVDVFDVSLPLLVRYLPMYAAAGHADPVAAFAADGVRLGFVRPSRRIRPDLPVVAPDRLHPPPVDLVLVRTPRYGERRCAPASPVPEI